MNSLSFAGRLSYTGSGQRAPGHAEEKKTKRWWRDEVAQRYSSRAKNSDRHGARRRDGLVAGWWRVRCGRFPGNSRNRAAPTHDYWKRRGCWRRHCGAVPGRSKTSVDEARSRGRHDLPAPAGSERDSIDAHMHADRTAVHLTLAADRPATGCGYGRNSQEQPTGWCAARIKRHEYLDGGPWQSAVARGQWEDSNRQRACGI